MLPIKKLAKSKLAAPAAPPPVNITFTVDPQEQGNWCWAAVSSSVSFFYVALSKWTQCQVASAELKGPCCASPTPCNVAWSLEAALTRTLNLAAATATPISTASIRSELTGNRPVCLRVAWKKGGAHFLGVKGHYQANGVEMLVLTDPIYGQSSTSALDLQNGSYQGNGKWTHTYTTKA